jgi:hypothetical protein
VSPFNKNRYALTGNQSLADPCPMARANSNRPELTPEKDRRPEDTFCCNLPVDMRFLAATNCRADKNAGIIADKRHKSYNVTAFVGLWYFSRRTFSTCGRTDSNRWCDASGETVEMY